jgi:hypothetical protein
MSLLLEREARRVTLKSLPPCSVNFPSHGHGLSAFNFHGLNAGGEVQKECSRVSEKLTGTTTVLDTLPNW